MTIDSSPALGARLSKWLALQVFISFAVVSVVVFVVIDNYLSSRQADELEEKRVHIEHLFDEGSGKDASEELWHKLDDFLASHHELQIEIYSSNGDTLYQGANQFAEAGNDGFTALSFPTPLLYGTVPNGVATIIYDNHADRELLKWLAFALAFASILASIAVATGAAWVVKREMRSVETLVSQIHQISASTLESRLDGAQQPQELQPIVIQFNELLDRLSDSYKQLENFNADVAHELNTPLTTLITSCELELRNADQNSSMDEVLGSNLEELHRMSEIIKSMMFLSRAERGSRPRCVEVSSVAEIISDVVDYHEAMLGEANVEVAIQGDEKGEFDVPLLKRAISNLLGNAVRYATPSSMITVTISGVDDTHIDITVMNLGESIETDALTLLFDRFYRAEASRSMADKHHGLGLSIVAAIARMHGGVPHAESANNETRIGFTLHRYDHEPVITG